MSFFIDVTKFLDETTLPVSVVDAIKFKRAKIKCRKGVYSENDAIGKEIASGVFGDLASAHFSRWMRSTYVIGDCDS